MKKFSGFSSNAAKLAGLVSMTVDHIGAFMFPSCIFLRAAGRIAFPVFAFISAESLLHTRSKSSYIFRLLGFGTIIQAVYFFIAEDLFFNIFLTFAISALLCVFYDCVTLKIMPKNKICSVLLITFSVFSILFTINVLKLFFKVNISFDGGSYGIFLPFFVYISKNKKSKLGSTAAVCVLMSLEIGGIQWFSLLALLLISFYNGKRGRYHLKYFFYLYYPLHIALIYGLSFKLK